MLTLNSLAVSISPVSWFSEDSSFTYGSAAMNVERTKMKMKGKHTAGYNILHYLLLFYSDYIHRKPTLLQVEPRICVQMLDAGIRLHANHVSILLATYTTATTSFCANTIDINVLSIHCIV